jgi:hypothetical protein
MWIPKTEDELKFDEKKREKNARFSGLFFFFFIPVITTLQNKFIGTQAYRGAPLESTLTWTQIIPTLPNLFFISSIGGILSYLAFRKFNEFTTQVCLKCGKLKRFKKNENCDCGGKLRLLNEMKWIESSEPNQDKE